MAWWIVLTVTLSAIRGRLSLRALRGANVVSGAAVTLFGLAAILGGLRG